MFFVYLFVIGVFALINTDAYSLTRSPRVKIVDNVHVDSFPEVEYPSSIVDSSKPFYLDVSPFSNDVQNSFKTLSTGGTTKQKPTIIINVKAGDNEKDKNKQKSIVPEKVDTKPITQAQDKNSTDKIPMIIDFQDDESSEETEYEFTNRLLKEQINDSEEMEYVLTFIEDLDEYITTFFEDEEFIDIDDTTKTCDNEHSNDTATITSDVTSENNESVTKLSNGTIKDTEASPRENTKDLKINEE